MTGSFYRANASFFFIITNIMTKCVKPKWNHFDFQLKMQRILDRLQLGSNIIQGRNKMEYDVLPNYEHFNGFIKNEYVKNDIIMKT